jgi:hypothetical protein
VLHARIDCDAAVHVAHCTPRAYGNS